jgi:hypothetical protein
MRFEPGSIIRFTYEHQDVDASTGDKFKEVFVLNPLWANKMHGLDLKRCTPAEREVLEAILDPDLKDKPHRIPLVNDIKRRMDPIELIRNPVVFYTKFVKPFMRKKDIYRQYLPSRMSGVTVVKGAKIKTGKAPVQNPLFGPKPMTGVVPKAAEPKALSPIDIMKQNAKNRGLK